MMISPRTFFFVLLCALTWVRVAVAAGAPLEIKFWPEDRIYVYTVADPWLHDIVLQNVAIINRWGSAIDLDEMHISVLRNGRITQDRLVDLRNMGQNLKSFYDKYKKG